MAFRVEGERERERVIEAGVWREKRVCRTDQRGLLWCTAQDNRSLQRIVSSPKVPGPQLIHAYSVVCLSVCLSNPVSVCQQVAMFLTWLVQYPAALSLSLHCSITILSICAIDMSCVSFKYLSSLSLSFWDVWILLLCHRKCQDGINECAAFNFQFSLKK